MKTCVLLFALLLGACGPQVILEAPRPSWDRCALLRCEGGAEDVSDATPNDAPEELDTGNGGDASSAD